MQKCQKCLLKQHVWGALIPQSDLRLNNTIIKMFLEFYCRRGLFNAKTPNSQFCISLPSDQPRETSDQKSLGTKSSQNLILGWVYFIQKFVIPKNLFNLLWSSMFVEPQCLRVTSDGPYPKIQNSAPQTFQPSS